MKYRDFKMLSTEDMKKIYGGNPPGEGGLKCKTKCYKWNNGTGQMDSSDCDKKTTTVGGVTLESCECGLAGATSCDAAV